MTSVELSEEQKALLEARRAEAEANPEAGLAWEEVKARIIAARPRLSEGGKQ